MGKKRWNEAGKNEFREMREKKRERQVERVTHGERRRRRGGDRRSEK